MADYTCIAHFYEQCFEKHGDNHKGLDWPNLPDLIRRYDVMLDVITVTDRKEENREVTLLDFGCGTAMLYEHIQQKGLRVKYSGLDLSPKFIEASRKKYPHLNFYCLDALKSPESLPAFDYIVMNGVFTEKIDLTFDQMLDFFKRMLRVVFPKANRGIAFNVMSKQVEWEKDILFHLPLDTLAFFLTKELTRHFVIRNDYGLYEYTTYVYR